MSVLYTLVPALSIVAFAIAIELIAPVERYSLKSRVRGIVFTVLNLVIGLALFGVLTDLWAALHIQPVVTISMTALGDGVAIACSLLLSDFISYWHHRFQHRFMWPIHAVHHSQTELHAANNYAHFLERLSRFLFFIVPMSMVQLNSPATPTIIIALISLLENYIHSPRVRTLGRSARSWSTTASTESITQSSQSTSTRTSGSCFHSGIGCSEPRTIPSRVNGRPPE